MLYSVKVTKIDAFVSKAFSPKHISNITIIIIIFIVKA